ncbi:hypothetical protein KCV01_g11892, partial [Aureobasidium melanogenum]
MNTDADMAVSIPLSVRVPQDDFEWLSALAVDGATTPSDKLRAIIQSHRRELEGTASYEAALGWLRQRVQPLAQEVASYEHRAGTRSEAIAAAMEWAPQLMALLVSSHVPADAENDAAARQLEDLVLQKSAALLGALLRLGIGVPPPTYSPDAIDRHVFPLGRLIDAVRVARG